MDKQPIGRVHPEVLVQVYDKFKELHVKNPTVDGTVLWSMARDYVYTMALVDTQILKLEMLI
jgi:hypothetical protein